MNFVRMIEEVMKGKHMARTIWVDKSVILNMESLVVGGEKWLCVFNAEGDKRYHPCIFREEDLMATDWEQVGEVKSEPVELKNLRGQTPVRVDRMQPAPAPAV